jgi:histidine triad (HIT) family protein
MADSIFTKIIKGEIPANKIYEDELTVAFLTIMPRQPGHTLVVPKKQIDQLWDLPDKDYAAVMATAKRVAQHMKEVLGIIRVGVLVLGEEVPHAHVHLIPFNDAGEFLRPPQEASPEDLTEMAAKLAF